MAIEIYTGNGGLELWIKEREQLLKPKNPQLFAELSTQLAPRLTALLLSLPQLKRTDTRLRSDVANAARQKADLERRAAETAAKRRALLLQVGIEAADAGDGAVSAERVAASLRRRAAAVTAEMVAEIRRALTSTPHVRAALERFSGKLAAPLTVADVFPTLSRLQTAACDAADDAVVDCSAEVADEAVALCAFLTELRHQARGGDDVTALIATVCSLTDAVHRRRAVLSQQSADGGDEARQLEGLALVLRRTEDAAAEAEHRRAAAEAELGLVEPQLEEMRRSAKELSARVVDSISQLTAGRRIVLVGEQC